MLHVAKSPLVDVVETEAAHVPEAGGIRRDRGRVVEESEGCRGDLDALGNFADLGYRRCGARPEEKGKSGEASTAHGTLDHLSRTDLL